MAGSQMADLLRSLQSGDNSVRSAAEKTYTDALASESGRVLVALVECLNTAACPDEAARTQAATLLRRAMLKTSSQETAWEKAGPDIRMQIRQALFQALEAEPLPLVRKIVVAGIATVASAEAEPWTDLVPNALKLASSDRPAHQESALRLLAELMSSSDVAQAILSRKQELGALIMAGLQAPSLQVAALNLVAEMMTALDSDSCQAMQPLLPMMEAALKNTASDASALEESLTSMVSCAMEQPAFFKPRYAEWVEIMLTFATAKGTIDDAFRRLAFEWIATVSESKSKVLNKAVPDLVEKVLRTAFMFLAEVEEDDGWVDVDIDEHEDDDDGLSKYGESKVDFFVKKLTFEKTGRSLLALMQQYGSDSRWEAKLAAAMSIRASVEYVNRMATLDTMTTLLLQLVQDPHMRVRYAALLALGQTCHDQESEFHERWHSRLIPLLVQLCADPVDRCSSMAIGALEAVIGNLEDSTLSEHAPPIIQALVGRLTSSKHKGVLVHTMECLGALAAGLEGSFDAYYDQLMAMLLSYVSQSDSHAATAKIRGKAFECISVLGFSVGREKFAPAAQQTMSAMLATAPTLDDMQTDCIRESMDRICKVLGSGFTPYLPSLLPGIFEGMRLDNAVSAAGEDDIGDSDELVVPMGDGFVKLKTGQMGEILALVSLLTCFVKETSAGYFDFVRPTAEALSRILACSDPVLNVASSVRDSVYPCWAELVSAVCLAVPTRGQDASNLAIELVQRFVDKVAGDLVNAEDPEDIAPMAHGIASVVRNAGAGCLQPQQCQTVCDLAVAEIAKSLQREQALKEANDSFAKAAEGAIWAAEDDDDEDDAGMLPDEEEEEQEGRFGLCSIFGACMKASPEVFVAHSWPRLQNLMQEWLKPGSDTTRYLALRLASELVEHLGAQSVAIWPVFMPAVIEFCNDDKADARNTASFTIILASSIPAFGSQYGSVSFNALGTALQKRGKPRKNDEDAQRALDNVVAALIHLCLLCPEACPDLDQCWQATLARLPLKADVEEGQKLNRRLFVEASKPNGGNLGTVERLARILGYLCEIYPRSDQCDDDLQKDIALAFAQLPATMLQGLMAHFPAKQQAKVDKVLQDGRKLQGGV